MEYGILKKFKWEYPYKLEYIDGMESFEPIAGSEAFYDSKKSVINFPDRRTAIFSKYLENGLQVKFCKYQDIVKTSGYIDYMLQRGTDLRENLDTSQSAAGVYVLVICTLMIDDTEFAIALRRSNKVMNYAGSYQFIPSGGVDSHFDYEVPTVIGTIKHELGEELFGIGEFESEPAIVQNLVCNENLDFIGVYEESMIGYGLVFNLRIPKDMTYEVISKLTKSIEGKPELVNTKTVFERFNEEEFVPSSYLMGKEVFKR